MRKASRIQLAADLVEWGARVVGKTEKEIREITGMGYTRSARLSAWLMRNGLRSPFDDAAVDPPDDDAAPREAKDDEVHILVVGDCHAAPEQNLRRFRWLARQVADLRPTHLVQIGDWYSLDALCRHSHFLDRSKERLKDDLAAGADAVAQFETTLTREAGSWRPDRDYHKGNHCERASALANDQPWLEGIVNVGAAHEAYGWNVIEFLEPKRIAGVRFQHYLTTEGGKGVISGKYHARRLLERTKFESVVVGHSHRLDVRVEADHFGRKSWAIVAGCYLEHDEPYAREDNREWWRGTLELRNVRDGNFDLVTWSMDRIQRRYGD